VIPYADSLYFSILVYPALLAIALGLAGKLSWRWVAGINAAMLVAQYGLPASHSASQTPRAIEMVASSGVLQASQTAATIGVVAGYAALQWAVARLFLRQRRQRASKAVFRAALAVSLLPMLAVKFLPDADVGWVGFLGISYVTFRSIDVIICIQDRLIQALPFLRYVTYVLFFPAVSSGPVDRYNRFIADLSRSRTRNEFLQDLDAAVHRLFRGAFYKFILASLVKRYWLDPAAALDGALSTASYMYAYSFYLFFDLAGYSAFAIAVSYLLGIRTPENFNRPFLATNMADFWNRWHITLSTWFRDHVYMRFMLAAIRGGWFKSRLLTSCLAFYVSFGLMGLWHGTAPRYLVYGFYQASLLAGHTVMTDYRKRHPGALPALPTLAAGFVTFHLVCFGLLIFSGRLG
jgi:membrane protein involved in D-alanine export